MKWKPISTAPSNKKIIIFCKAYKGEGYALFQACYDEEYEVYFVPCPQSRDDHWIDLTWWEPVHWSEIEEGKS